MKTAKFAWLYLFALVAAFPADGQTFSLASFPPSSGVTPPAGIPPDGIAFPGPAPYLPGAGPILPGATSIDVDAIDYGHFGFTGFSAAKVAHYEFSVTLFSPPPVGVGAVAAEAATFNHFADIYSSDGTGGNVLLWDGDGIPAPGVGLAGALGIAEAVPNDVDAWANSPGASYSGKIFFSVDIASAAAAYVPPFSAGSVFVAPVIPPYDLPAGLPAAPAFAVLYAAAPALFLDLVGGPNSDDLDALVVLDNGDFVFGGTTSVDTILFSLKAGSPALGGPGPYAGKSPADILFANSAGAAGLFLPAPALGLLPSTDLDALDIQIKPEAISVLPGTNSDVYVSWSDLDPPRVYKVASATTESAPTSWSAVGSISATAISQTWTNTGVTNAAVLFRLER